MLREYVSKEAINDCKNDIIKYMIQSKNKIVRKYTFFDQKYFGAGINIFKVPKSSCSNPLEAFVICWLENFLWVEDCVDIFDYTAKNSIMLFKEFFWPEVSKYKISESTVKDSMDFILNKILVSRLNVKEYQEAHPEEYDKENIPFLGVPGLYIDEVYSNKFIKVFEDNILQVEKLFSDIFGTQSKYREYLIEGEKFYYLFCDR